MQLRPSAHQTQLAPRQVAFHHAKRLYIDFRLVLLIRRVEMRGRMVGKVHPNYDSEKCTDGWHHPKLAADARRGDGVVLDPNHFHTLNSRAFAPPPPKAWSRLFA